MTIRKYTIKCPICDKNFLSATVSSCFVFGQTTDLARVGLAFSYPEVHSCQHCKYVYIDENLDIDKIKVQKLLMTDAYQELYEKYSDTDKDSFNQFKIIYEIYRSLEIDIYAQHSILLYSYYKDNSLKNFKYLIDEIEKDLTLYKEHLLNCYPIDFYRGEYYRRIGEFNKAQEIFEKIIKEYKEEKYLKIANFQLQLIAQKDTECRTIE